MNIQYYGHSCFKITTKPAGRATKDVVIVIDPFDNSVGLRSPQGQADVVFITHDHKDHNNTNLVKGDCTLVDSPGEYAISGINAFGLDTFHDEKGGTERGLNTIYVIETEDLKICHLGDLGCDLTPEQIEKINGIDVLFVPVGGKFTIDGKKAAEVSRKLEPSVVIPMHYKIKGSKLAVSSEKEFCDEMGTCQFHDSNKFSLKKKDLENKNEEVIVLKSV